MSLCAANWSAGSKYEHKRSKTLLKVKTFYDEDLFFALVMKEVAFTKRLMSSDATVRKCWYPGFLLNFYQIGTKCRGPKRPIDSVNWTFKSTGGHRSGPCRWHWPCGRDVRAHSYVKLQTNGALRPVFCVQKCFNLVLLETLQISTIMKRHKMLYIKEDLPLF